MSLKRDFKTAPAVSSTIPTQIFFKTLTHCHLFCVTVNPLIVDFWLDTVANYTRNTQKLSLAANAKLTAKGS